MRFILSVRSDFHMTWEQWQWRGTPHSPKPQHHWNLTIRLFSVIYRTLVGWWSYPSVEVQSAYFTGPADWATKIWFICKMFNYSHDNFQCSTAFLSNCTWFYLSNHLFIQFLYYFQTRKFILRVGFEDIKRNKLYTMSKEVFQQYFQQWKTRWNKC